MYEVHISKNKPSSSIIVLLKPPFLPHLCNAWHNHEFIIHLTVNLITPAQIGRSTHSLYYAPSIFNGLRFAKHIRGCINRFLTSEIMMSIISHVSTMECILDACRTRERKCKFLWTRSHFCSIELPYNHQIQ